MIRTINNIMSTIKGEFKTLREASKHKKFLISLLAWWAYIEIVVCLGYIILSVIWGIDLQFLIILNSVVNTGLYMGGANYLLRLEDQLNKGE